MTKEQEIKGLVEKQRRYFLTQATKTVVFRMRQLKKLRKAVVDNKEALVEALWADLRKCREEVMLTEYNIVIAEIDEHIRNIKYWVESERVRTPMFLKPSGSRVIYEPYGVALVIAPWNYPFNLMFCPLVGAISAGCCAVLKPSPYSVNTSALMSKMIRETFDEHYIASVEGNREVNTLLLKQHFDMIFYTGSPAVGKVVMEAAAKHLTPVVLELGGKSPCIVDKKCNIEYAARRIVWGRTINAGQTCVAPDYLFVHKDVKEVLIKKMINCVERFYGKNMQKSRCYCRIINDKAFQRLLSYLSDGQVIYGGNYDAADRYMQFTLLDNVAADAAIMRDEIFGPLLPVMTFDDIKEVISFVNGRPKPLALYYFGSDDAAKEVLKQTISGGACINDTVLHVANGHLPFGGVGNSGMGKYHSYYSFLAFSNIRAVLKSSNMIDFTVKYPPYNNFGLVDKLM